MKKGLIGKKIGMTQIFDEAGNVIPVTVVEAGPCTVTQIKTVENDGYQAVQVGFGDVKVSRVNKPMKGHFDKADVAPKKTLKEFRLDSIDGIEVGNILKADTFEVGEIVDVKGTSKGPREHIILACYILPTWHDITEMLKKQLKNISQALLVLLFIMFQPVQLHGNFYQ